MITHCPTALLCLFAARDPRLDGLASQFRKRNEPVDLGTLAWLAALAVGMVVVFWIAARLVERHERRTNCPHPWRLFWSLSRAHRLRWLEVLFLWRLARHQGLHDPARLFLEPERFTPQQTGRLLGARADLLESLRSRLFASLHEPETGASSFPPVAEHRGAEPEGGAVSGPTTLPSGLCTSWTSSGDTPSAAET